MILSHCIMAKKNIARTRLIGVGLVIIKTEIFIVYSYNIISCSKETDRNKAGYTAIQSRTVGQEQRCENHS